jgi:hypothetical protein
VSFQPAQQARTYARQGIKRREATEIAVHFPVVDDAARQVGADAGKAGNVGRGRAVEVDQLAILQWLARKTRAVPVCQG